tara:strand:+ start:229 stop:597 length:369 start_codon:yes stop_codon:yes gene_type:complete
MTETKVDLSVYPYELRVYIAERHKECTDGNQADFRPTYQPELDSITEVCVDQWNRGQSLIEEMTEQEHEQCKALFYLEHREFAEIRKNKLRTIWWDAYEYMVPAYVSKLASARYLQPFFKEQ